MWRRTKKISFPPCHTDHHGEIIVLWLSLWENHLSTIYALFSFFLIDVFQHAICVWGECVSAEFLSHTHAHLHLHILTFIVLFALRKCYRLPPIEQANPDGKVLPRLIDWERFAPPPHTELFWITLSYRFVITPCYYYYYYVVRVSRCYYFSRSWAVCLSSILVRAENGRVVSLAGFSLSRICGARISKRFGFPDFNCLVVTIVYCLSFIYLSIVIFRLPCFVLFVSHSLQQPPISSTYTHYIHEGWTPAPNHTHTYPPHESCYSWPVLPG